VSLRTVDAAKLLDLSHTAVLREREATTKADALRAQVMLARAEYLEASRDGPGPERSTR
jgi:hypothetical protein